ncbi:MAG: MBOAT family protein [Saprospiraceae bacterium]|nr:MBOAT family protein [Saprospiraceae bacterium]
MLFNSFVFLCFFVVFFAIYWSMPRKALYWQNAVLLLASYVFYGWWDWRYLSLISLASLTSFLGALGIEDKPSYKKPILFIVLLVHLGMLAYFKYAGFFVSSLMLALNSIGFKMDVVYLQIALPVGISFFTFQSLSYAIDVYRRNLTASRSWIEYFSFVSFFPQLVAGPIERAGNLLPQIQQQRYFNFENAGKGLQLILWGLIKKMMVADVCAPVVDSIFSNSETASLTELWWGIFLFGVQIYCDFSAYSEMAMGLALLLGFQLMKNFNYPYFATNIQAFWKRWHISLTTWFKDYIFLPLGGSRVGKNRLLLNIVIVFLISGLWHGANFTFLAWGFYHAILYGVYIIWLAKWQIRVPTLFGWFFTFFCVLVGWVFFRAADIWQAGTYIEGLFSPQRGFSMHYVDVKLLMSLALLVFFEWLHRHHSFGLDLGSAVSQPIRWSLYLLLLTLWLVYANFDEQAFIYFDF